MWGGGGGGPGTAGSLCAMGQPRFGLSLKHSVQSGTCTSVNVRVYVG